MRHLRKCHIYSCIEMRLHTHSVEACLVACAKTYTRERIYATHVLVTVLRGSTFCGLRKNLHKHRCTGVHIFGDAKNSCPNLILFFPNNV